VRNKSARSGGKSPRCGLFRQVCDHVAVIGQGLEGYGRFGSLSRVELERFFHLDDEDRRLIGKRRGDHSRLGFALQVVTVRHLGMFLADPLDVPVELVDYLAEQLGIEDPSCVKQYTERRRPSSNTPGKFSRSTG
jgi:hypothetical protein